MNVYTIYYLNPELMNDTYQAVLDCSDTVLVKNLASRYKCLPNSVTESDHCFPFLWFTVLVS